MRSRVARSANRKRSGGAESVEEAGESTESVEEVTFSRLLNRLRSAGSLSIFAPCRSRSRVCPKCEPTRRLAPQGSVNKVSYLILLHCFHRGHRFESISSLNSCWGYVVNVTKCRFEMLCQFGCASLHDNLCV